MRNFAKQNYDAAADSLKKAIEDARLDQCDDQVSLLLQFLGNVSFESGRIDTAIKYYDEADRIQPGSLGTKYGRARFLYEKLHDYESTVEVCDCLIEYIDKYNSKNFNKSERIACLEIAYSLKGCALCKLGDYKGAVYFLNKIGKLPEHKNIEYGIELCKILILENKFPIENIDYMLNVANEIDRVKFGPFAEELDQLIYKLRQTT